jgi:peroxiredoxin
MRFSLFLAGVFLMGGGAAASLQAAGELSNRRAPGFALPDSNINYHDLADYRGKIVLLDLIKTSCPVCNSSHKIMESVRQKYPDKVTILSIVPAGEDNTNTVRAFVAANSVKTPVLFDQGQVMASYLKLTPKNSNIGLPHLFLIDANGIIRNDWEFVGNTVSVFDSLPALQKEVEALLAASAGPAKPATAAGPAPAKK